jgi:hypothetical protein
MIDLSKMDHRALVLMQALNDMVEPSEREELITLFLKSAYQDGVIDAQRQQIDRMNKFLSKKANP